MRITLTAQTLVALRERHATCLCLDCLRALNAATTAP